MIPAGRLRHFVYFDAPETTLDSDGIQEELWVEQFDGQLIAADIQAMSGRELIAASATQSKVTTRIKVRYREGYAPAWRVRHRSEVYNIEAVIPDPDSRLSYLTLLCTSGVNDG